MGGWLLRVPAVVVYLEQDGKVHKNLQQTTSPELDRSLCKQEVDGLKGVPAGPHQHHFHTGREKAKEQRDGLRSAQNLSNS